IGSPANPHDEQRQCKQAADPFVQPKIFANKRYTAGLVLAVLINGMGIALYYVSPLLLSSVQELSTNWIGFVMVPAAVASALLGRVGGKLADRKGNAYLFFLASGLLLVCFGLLSTFTGIAVIGIACFLIFGNVGQSFMQITLANSISVTLAKEQAGVGMGIFSMLKRKTPQFDIAVAKIYANVRRLRFPRTCGWRDRRTLCLIHDLVAFFRDAPGVAFRD
ncbi:MFS transporter, partial [Rhizobium ruizarguesonis]